MQLQFPLVWPKKSRNSKIANGGQNFGDIHVFRTAHALLFHANSSLVVP